ncbi:MAG: ribosome small subunit-dependent GTPase A [Paludibacteraceae bacterium]|nr:ribosome small subunit-dependent GTPase A [Paludibacteraceae bacterium]
MQALVIRSTGTTYTVLRDDGTIVEAHIKGNMRLKGIRTTNPVAVGDRVEVAEQTDGTYWLTRIEPRRNYIIRRATNLSKEAHILAANIDQTALIVTLHHPITSTVFIDRFLATAEAYSVPAILIFNKIDLLSEEETEQLLSLRRLYESLGYPTIALSALQPATRDVLLPLLSDKTTLLSGNSGVGKSTLLNTIFGKQLTRTGDVSAAHDKGMHTTTFSEMYALPSGGWLIDTPGIKGFGSVEMQKEEVSHYFREIFAIGRNCRFGNCLHTGEPGCAVVKAVENGQIAFSRFDSYLSLLGDTDENKYR